MRIKRVHIKNFRGIEDLEVDFSRVTTLIGPNGAGKSTVLRALDWFFNGQKAELTDDDCTFGSGSKRIEVEVEFCDLTDQDREQLGHYAPEGASRFIAWKYREEDGAETMSANAKVYKPFAAIRPLGARDMKTAYLELSRMHPELELPSATTRDAILEAMTNWESQHPQDLTESQEAVTNFFGFNSQAKMAGLFDFVFVAADMRASEEAVDGKATIVGKILERAVDRTLADTEIAALAEEVKGQQQEIYDRNFNGQLEDLSRDFSNVVAQYTTGRDVKIKTKGLELQPPKTQFTVSVQDSEVETSIAHQGHGFQRTLLIAALQLLAQRGAAGQSDGVICLAIEEPELFQHPVQAQAFNHVLRELADDASQNIQVAYATHSPYFVGAQHFEDVRRITRLPNPDPSRAPIVQSKSASVNVIKTKLAGLVNGDTIDRQISGVYLNKLPEALFANGVVLVEGTTDKAIIEGSAEREGVSLSVSGVVVVEAGGKPNLYLPYAILQELGIPCFLVFDGDRGQGARMAALGKTARDITNSEADSIRHNRAILRYLGETEEDWPTSAIRDKHAVLEDTLETSLEADWSEWRTERDAIIAAGLGSKDKNALIYHQAARQATTEPPQFVRDLVDKGRSLSS